MPSYKITDPDSGKTMTLTGDSPPTEEELNHIFDQVHGPSLGTRVLAKGAELAFKGGDALANTSALPIAGGIAGGVVGGLKGPQSDAMAGLMGGGGEAVRQLLARGLGFPAPATSADAGQQIALQAGGQAAANAMGQYVVGPAVSMGLKGARAVAERALPGFFKATAGVPEAATEAVLKNPDVLKKPGTQESVKSATENLIDVFKQTKQRVGDSIGKIFKKYTGLDDPITSMISAPESGATVGSRPYTGISVSEKPDLVGGTEPVTGTMGLRAPTVATSPKSVTPPTFADLTAKYRDVMSGDALKTVDAGGSATALSNKDQLASLTQLKRQIQAEANYNKNPITLAPIDGVKDAALKKMAADVDAVRTALPNGKKLAIADEAWTQIHDIFDTVQRDLSDPGKAQDTIMRVLKGDSTWLTAGRMGVKVDAIRRMEQLSGKNLLEPVKDELTSLIFKQWGPKGLSPLLTMGAGAGSAMTEFTMGHPLAALATLGATATTSPRMVGLGLRGGIAAAHGLEAAAPQVGKVGASLGLASAAKKKKQ